MNCSCCKKQIPDDSKFCQFCGSAVEETVQKPQPPVAIHADSQENTVIPGSIQDNSVPNLIKRGFLFLEDGMWKKANLYFEKALDIDIECAEAYLGKLLAELRVKTKEDLAKIEKEFDQKANYQKALRFSEGEFREELERLPLEWRYQKAIAAAKEKKYRQALERLEGIPDYRDAEQMRKEYFLLEKEAERQAKFLAKTTLFAVLLLSLFIIVALLVEYVIIPNNRYNDAIALAQTGEYAKAFKAFDNLSNYRDSKQQKEKMEIQLAAQAKVGDTITFGSYSLNEWNEYSEKNVRWLVLDKQGDRILLLSKSVLFYTTFDAPNDFYYKTTSGALHAYAYNQYDSADRVRLSDMDKQLEDGTWKNSWLRGVLHKPFINQAFTSQLQEVLLSVTNTNLGESNSQDVLFLLTRKELEKYLPNLQDRKTNGSWWLRSSGKKNGVMEYVDKNGNLIDDSANISSSNVKKGNRGRVHGVRPAMWIDISKAAG